MGHAVMDNDGSLLAVDRIALFRGVPPAALERLKGHLRRRDVPGGQLLMSAEQQDDTVYVILEGTLKIFLLRQDGSEVTLSILGPGQTVGEMSLVDSTGRSANVMAMERSELLVIDSEPFRQVLAESPGLAGNLLQLITQRLRLANEQVQALASLDAAGRVARQLLAFAEQYGESRQDGVRIPLRLTQSDLAALIGTSRERVNRVMVSFRQQGILSADEAYRITLHQRRALADQCR